MKKLILSTSLFCCTFLSASPMLDVANVELESAKEQYAQVLKNAEDASAKKRAEYATLCNQINEANKQLADLKKQANELSQLKQKQTYYKEVCAELSDELQRVCKDEKIRAVSANEIFLATKNILSSEFDAIKNPLKFIPIEVVDIKSKQKLTGNLFRIGGFRYFVSQQTCGFVNNANELYGKDYSVAISDFINSKSSSIAVDTSFGKLEKFERNHLTLSEEIKKGGVWVYPILFLGGLSVFVVFAKVIQFLFIRVPKKALEIAIVNAQSVQAKEDVAYEFIAKTNFKLKGLTSVLTITATVSPLLGLLGTVSGIIKTFADLSANSSQAGDISDGIAEALITTEYGLIVAIPALIANALISRRIMKITEKLRSHATELIVSEKNK